MTKSTIDSLWALQTLEFSNSKPTEERAKQMEALRSEIPETLLHTFERFVVRKKKPVAMVRHRVCSECHVQIAVGILGSLAFGQGLHQCGNCGRFLYLPEDEPVAAPEKVAKPKRPRAARKSALAGT